MSPQQFTSRKVPRSALQFAAELVPGTVEATAGDDGATLYPFVMTARTGGIAQHPWWGNCIHDFEGMIPAKPTITVDYCHNPDDVIGFADRQELRDNALMLSGSLVSLGDDRAFEVQSKRKAGVPYEASILTNWDGLVIEQISEGMVATVNGQQVDGPLTIFREWQLWGVAVCPYGSDGNTGIEFSAGSNADVEVRVIAPAAADPVAKSGRDFIARFGRHHGALWFTEGKSWDESLSLWGGVLQDQKAAKDREAEELKAQLAELQKKYDALVKDLAAAKAENAAFKGPYGLYTEPARVELVQKRFSNLSQGMAAFAASIKLPKDPASPQ